MSRRELSGRRQRHDGQDLLQQVLEERYLLKDGQGHVIEDARQMVERVAGVMQRRVFQPNSPTLMNAGRPCGLLSNSR